MNIHTDSILMIFLLQISLLAHGLDLPKRGILWYHKKKTKLYNTKNKTNMELHCIQNSFAYGPFSQQRFVYDVENGPKKMESAPPEPKENAEKTIDNPQDATFQAKEGGKKAVEKAKEKLAEQKLRKILDDFKRDHSNLLADPETYRRYLNQRLVVMTQDDQEALKNSSGVYRAELPGITWEVTISPHHHSLITTYIIDKNTEEGKTISKKQDELEMRKKIDEEQEQIARREYPPLNVEESAKLNEFNGRFQKIIDEAIPDIYDTKSKTEDQIRREMQNGLDKAFSEQDIELFIILNLRQTLQNQIIKRTEKETQDKFVGILNDRIARSFQFGGETVSYRGQIWIKRGKKIDVLFP